MRKREPDQFIEIDVEQLHELLFKTGLSDDAAAAMYGLGFSDREIAKRLAAVAPLVTNDQSARAWVRQNAELARATSAPFPAYFHNVLYELLS